MISAGEARRLCPQITLQHVATFRSEGEDVGEWKYRGDHSVVTDKVSLGPYRAESRKILRVFGDELARWQRQFQSDEDDDDDDDGPILEKASVDEAFIDLSCLVYGVLLQRYPQLSPSSSLSYDVPDRLPPPPPENALNWSPQDNLIDIIIDDDDDDDHHHADWDDVALLIGSEIVRSLREAVWRTLHYTCSAGIARNKMMAKLGSSSNKPNKQTVIRNRAVQNFLAGIPFTKIRMLGGKLGDRVSTVFGGGGGEQQEQQEQLRVKDLLHISLNEFRKQFDEETAAWLYGIIRGEDRSEVTSRTQMKSMASAKSFRPAIKSLDQAERWLRIFVADIHGRLVEEEDDDKQRRRRRRRRRRRPRTIALHYRQGIRGGQVRSRQIPIPVTGQPVDQTLLLELGRTLLRQAVVEDCTNLSLSVADFQESSGDNKAIDGFLVRGEQAKRCLQTISGTVQKRRKADDIQQFLGGFNTSSFSSDGDEVFFLSCDRCGIRFPEAQKGEHDDWHFAKDLAAQERREHDTQVGEAARGSGNRKRAIERRTEKGQMRLNFG